MLYHDKYSQNINKIMRNNIFIIYHFYYLISILIKQIKYINILVLY